MKAEIYYLKKLDAGFSVEQLMITDYKIPQLDRLENKVDRILELLEGQELSTSVLGNDEGIPIQKLIHNYLEQRLTTLNV